MSRFTVTSEAVTEGHPDKVCDAISDALGDDLLRQDPESHVACETLATKQLVVVSGEVRSNGASDVEALVKNTLQDIGYTDFIWVTFGYRFRSKCKSTQLLPLLFSS